MKILRKNKIKFFVLGFAFLALGFELVACKEEASAGDREVKRVSLSELGLYPNEIRTSILRIVLLNGFPDVESLDFDSAKNLDFSKNGDQSYGDNPKWEVFNPQGGGANKNTLNINILHQHSNADNFIITLSNKLENSKSSQNDLLAVLPDMRKESCEKIIEWVYKKTASGENKVKVPQLDTHPDLTSYPRMGPSGAVFPLNEENYGCVEVEGKYYYYQLIYAF